MLQQCIDSLVQKIQHGVVINFEKDGPDPVPLFPAESTCFSIRYIFFFLTKLY